MLTWKYTLPAFLVPFAFTLTPEGAALLLRGPASTVAWTAGAAAIAIAAFAGAFGGWILAPAARAERLGLGASGCLLLVANFRLNLVGLALIAVVLVLHWRRPQSP